MDAPLSQPNVKGKKREKCNYCNKRKLTDESHRICNVCFKSKTSFNPSGSEAVDDFIRYTQTNCGNQAEKMEFVSYDRFKDVEFVAEGGFSTVQSAFCIKNSDNINVSLPQSEFQIVVWRSM